MSNRNNIDLGLTKADLERLRKDGLDILEGRSPSYTKEETINYLRSIIGKKPKKKTKNESKTS